jgi:hypothetical protein
MINYPNGAFQKHRSRILSPHVAGAAAGAAGSHETSTIAFKNTSHPSRNSKTYR